MMSSNLQTLPHHFDNYSPVYISQQSANQEERTDSSFASSALQFCQAVADHQSDIQELLALQMNYDSCLTFLE